MAWFAGIRALALLRRACRALERSAAADEELARIAAFQHNKRFRVHGEPRPFEVGELDVAAANRAWRKERDEEMIDELVEREP